MHFQAQERNYVCTWKKEKINNLSCFRKIVHFILELQRKLASKLTHIQEFKTFFKTTIQINIGNKAGLQ